MSEVDDLSPFEFEGLLHEWMVKQDMENARFAKLYAALGGKDAKKVFPTFAKTRREAVTVTPINKEELERQQAIQFLESAQRQIKTDALMKKGRRKKKGLVEG